MPGDMASSKGQLLVPDQTLISGIFPDAKDIKATDCNIITNTFDECTFSIHGDADIGVHTSTTSTLPDYEDSKPRAWIGGPSLGYFPDIRHFLRGVLQANSPKTPVCELVELDNSGVLLKSTFGDMGSVELTSQDLDDLQRNVVFCHNDLEPRNILVSKISRPEDPNPRYELAAIIDWEMAGLYPFAYESGLKGCILGSSNLSFTWYSLFKQRTSHLLPEAECHTKFVECLRLIFDSRKRTMSRNVGLRIQARWIAHYELERAAEVRLSWVRKSGAKPIKILSQEDVDKLEQEVLKELGIVN
jgi:hypothetical protein